MKLAIDTLEIVAVAEGDPPVLPWRALPPVARRMGQPGEAIWVSEQFANDIYGFVGDADDLDRAVEEGFATRLEQPHVARSRHVVVRSADGFEYLHRDVATRRRRSALRESLRKALDLLDHDADEREVRLAFESASAIDPDDVLTAVLRAGFACRTADEEWCNIGLDDLERTIERAGSIEAMLKRPEWSKLPQPSLRSDLLASARRGLDRLIELQAQRLEPVDIRHQVLGAALAELRGELRRRLPLRHDLLVGALDGDPASVDTAWEELAKHPDLREHKERYFRSWQAVGESWSAGPSAAHLARASTSDLRRFARTLSSLESCSGTRQRDAMWQAFSSRTADLVDQRSNPVAPWSQGEELANALRRRLDLDGEPIACVTALVEHRAGIHAGATRLPSDGAHAAATAPRHVPPCLFIEPANGTSRQRALRNRFSLMHELAHILVDRDGGRDTWVCTTSADGYPGDPSPAEKRANAFAAYVLAPRDAVKQVATSALPSIGGDEFVRLALDVRDRFGLSAVAAGQHVLNCVYPREQSHRLDGEVRQKLRDADQRSPTREFEQDEDPDPEALPAAATPSRRGEFARLVRECLRVGEISLEEGSRFLGVDASVLANWQATAD